MRWLSLVNSGIVHCIQCRCLHRRPKQRQRYDAKNRRGEEDAIQDLRGSVRNGRRVAHHFEYEKQK